MTGFTLSSNSLTCTSDCSATLSNCLFCSSTTVCTVCGANYVLSNGTCVLPCATIANCQVCATTTLCQSCASNYQLSATATTCDLICLVPGCASCASALATSCTTCASGYSPYTSGQNTLCAKDCGQGELNTGNGTVNCQVCSTLIANCDTCALQTGSTTAYCVNCLAGYFVSGLSCSACTVISNCLTCSGASTCTQCAAGYNLILGACSNQACANTTTNCHVCSTTNNAVCITCEPGYSLSSGACSPITCSNGFVFDSTTNQCGCASGTYLSGTTCQPCSDGNCLTCSLSVCSSCVDGYYPFGSACQACIANCKTCSNGIACTQCSQGYSLTTQGTCMYYGQGGDSATTNSNGVVLRCDPGCQVCVTSSVNALSTICTTPMQGYSIVSGAIRKCPSSCLSCDGALAT